MIILNRVRKWDDYIRVILKMFPGVEDAPVLIYICGLTEARRKLKIKGKNFGITVTGSEAIDLARKLGLDCIHPILTLIVSSNRYEFCRTLLHELTHVMQIYQGRPLDEKEAKRNERLIWKVF